MQSRFWRAILIAAIAFAGAPLSALAAAPDEVNIYSYRQEFLIRPFLDAFTAQSGIKVNVVFAKTGMLERLKAEGRNSPADLVLTSDISRLDELVRADLVQAVTSDVLAANVPARYRHPDGLWFGLSLRARVFYVSKARVKPGEISRYEDLAEPKWRGRICMRSSRHVYNRALLASMIAAHGEAGAAQWLEGLAANLAMKPQGNDRAQAKAIWNGKCDVAIANHYYFAMMKFNRKKPEQRQWAAAIRLVFPNRDGRGTHVNISGMAMTRSAKHRDAALKLMEFLSGAEAQAMYAAINYEYPVKQGVPVDPEVASWGALKADILGLGRIAELSPLAAKLFQQSGLP